MMWGQIMIRFRAGASQLRRCVPVGTILLVENDGPDRRALAKLLDSDGYCVLQAKDGEDAINVCKRHIGRIDLVVMSLVLPDMASAELARRLVALRPDVRVLCH